MGVLETIDYRWPEAKKNSRFYPMLLATWSLNEERARSDLAQSLESRHVQATDLRESASSTEYANSDSASQH